MVLYNAMLTGKGACVMFNTETKRVLPHHPLDSLTQGGRDKAIYSAKCAGSPCRLYTHERLFLFGGRALLKEEGPTGRKI